MVKYLLLAFFLFAYVSADLDWTADQFPKKWIDYSKSKLKESLTRKLNGNLAKNLVFFLGDGIVIVYKYRK